MLFLGVRSAVPDMFSLKTLPNLLRSAVPDMFSRETLPNRLRRAVPDMFSRETLPNRLRSAVPDMFSRETLPNQLRRSFQASREPKSPVSGSEEGFFSLQDTKKAVFGATEVGLYKTRQHKKE